MADLRDVQDDSFVADAIMLRVQRQTGVSVASQQGRSRTDPVCYARMLTVTQLRRMGWSLPRIGRQLGRDHTTIQHIIQTGAKRRMTDDVLHGELERLNIWVEQQADRKEMVMQVIDDWADSLPGMMRSAEFNDALEALGVRIARMM